jgi:hypothetical protein
MPLAHPDHTRITTFTSLTVISTHMPVTNSSHGPATRSPPTTNSHLSTTRVLLSYTSALLTTCSVMLTPDDLHLKVANHHQREEIRGFSSRDVQTTTGFGMTHCIHADDTYKAWQWRSTG